MIPTPKTDANEFFIGINPDEGEMVVNSTIARDLERQLHLATLEIQSLHSIIAKHQQRLDKIISALCLPSHSPTVPSSSPAPSLTPSPVPEQVNTTKITPE